jgi:UDP-glucose 4-epimerase
MTGTIMHVLVTGGAGFIGSHLVDRVLTEGHTVRVIDNFASGKREHLDEAARTGRLELIEGSILDDGCLQRAMVGVDAVYHMAVECVRKSIGEPLANHEINATGTLRVLEAARRQGVWRFVYCSSSEVYGNSSGVALDEDRTICRPTTVYGGAKLVGEHYTLAYWQTYGLPAMVVRPFNAFGPRAHDQGQLAEVIPRFVIRVLNGLPPVIFGDGGQGRDFTYVTDTVEGLWHAGTSERTVGTTINIGWGRPVTVRQVAETVIERCGRNDLGVEQIAERPGDIQSLIASTDKARKMLGFTPTVAFADGIDRYIAWFRQRYPDPSRLVERDVVNWALPPREPN